MGSLKRQPNLSWEKENITSQPLEHSEFIVEVTNASEPEIDEKIVVGFDFEMKRKVGSYIYEYFVPCLLMVVTSWASFAVKPEAVPGRLGMLLTLFLMLVNMSSTISEIIPKSDLVCPLVMWILISIVFVFAALLEYFIILLSVKGATNHNIIFLLFAF